MCGEPVGALYEGERRFDKEIKLPEGYRVEWLGMFENLARARTHFLVLIPVTILLIYVLLWVTFGSQRAAVVVLLAVYAALQHDPAHAVDRDFVLETIVTRMPYENYEKIFNTVIRWARFGDLFFYDQVQQRISLGS